MSSQTYSTLRADEESILGSPNGTPSNADAGTGSERLDGNGADVAASSSSVSTGRPPKRGQYALVSIPAHVESSVETPHSAWHDGDASATEAQRNGSRWPSLSQLSSTPLFKVLVAGVGFCTDAYDLFVINLVLVLISYDYTHQTAADRSLIATAVLVGSVIGQLLFGVLADYIGRRKGFIATLTLLIVGAAMSATSFETKSVSVFACLALWRFVLGVGIGGEYPLAATVSSEANVAVEGRGKRVAATFSMQGVGALAAPLVVLMLLAMSGAGHVAVIWRVALGLGALPGLGMIYWRIRMQESEAFTQAARASTSVRSGSNHSAFSVAAVSALLLATREKLGALHTHWRTLMGTAGSWLIFDIVFYANGLFSSSVVSHWYVPPTGADAADGGLVHAYLVRVATASLMLALCALPGYWGGMALIDRIGRRKLQLLGYTGMIVTYVLCGAMLPLLADHKAAFLALYGFSFFWCNCGPNVTTFVIPSEAFPTTVRATAHGLSAAAGKLGAVLGGALMPAVLESHGLAAVMYACAFISAFGWAWTWWWTEESSLLLMMEASADASQDEVELGRVQVSPTPQQREVSHLGSENLSAPLHSQGYSDDADLQEL